MNRHGYTIRIGQPGQDLWQCQKCGDKGPFLELMARGCSHKTTQKESEEDILDAVGAKARREMQEEIDKHDEELIKS